MTLQQIRIAVEAAEKNSVSLAAEKNNIAQSNASAAIKKLEEELGYPLFRRVGNGISMTDEGYRFLDHAAILIREADAISSINSEESIPRLRLGVTNYTPPIDAFIEFCSEHKDAKYAQFACVNTSFEEGAVKLKDLSLDLVVALLLKSSMNLAEELCKINRLTMSILSKVPICVRVGKDHPLLKSGVLDGSTKGFQKLSDYPDIEYKSLRNMLPAFNDSVENPFGSSYKIYVEERDTRLRILNETNAFNVGCELPDRLKKEYGIVTIPIKNTYASLATFVRKGDEELPDTKHYMELLQDHFDSYYK